MAQVFCIWLVFIAGYNTLNSCSREDAAQSASKENVVFDPHHDSEKENTSPDNYSSSSEPEHATTGSVKGRNGSRLKSIHYKTYNTDNVFVVELTYYTLDYESLASSSIQVRVNGLELDQNIVNRNICIFSFSLSEMNPGWRYGDLVEWSFTETGSEEPISFRDSYYLVDYKPRLFSQIL